MERNKRTRIRHGLQPTGVRKIACAVFVADGSARWRFFLPRVCRRGSSGVWVVPILGVRMTVALLTVGAKLVFVAVWIVPLLTIGRTRAGAR